MTDSEAAMMVKDMIRDCLEGAVPEHPDGDTSYGSMMVEGNCSGFADVVSPIPGPGDAYFTFEQSGFRYTVGVLAERLR